jgi:hypothetical protein
MKNFSHAFFRILAKSLIISFQYNIESVYFFYGNPVSQPKFDATEDCNVPLISISGIIMYRLMKYVVVLPNNSAQ